MKERTIKLTSAQALIRFLSNQYFDVDGKEHKYIKGFWTIFGHGNVLGIGQALEQEEHDFIIHQGRNEQGMAHSAIGFAKQNNRTSIYACTSSIGPGSANMLTAAGTATANRIPLLLILGDTFASRQPDPVLQQIEHSTNLTLTTNDSFKAVTTYWDRINRPEQIMSALINAMRTLTDPAKCGAVAIAFPQDVQGESYEYPESFFKKRIHYLPRILPDIRKLSQALELLKQSKKPLIICGGGVKYSFANDALLKFSSKYHIPLAETQAGKSAISSSYNLNLGGIGVTGNLCSNNIANEADLIIGVGTRYSDFTTGSKSLFKNPAVKFLNINICNFDCFKLDGLDLKGDAKTILEYLLENLEGVEFSIKDHALKEKAIWLEELNRLHSIKYFKNQEFTPEISGHLENISEEFSTQTSSVLCQTTALGIINKTIAKDSVIVGSSGSLPGDLQRIWHSEVTNTYNMEYGYSCMGYEVNGALGVKIAIGKKREVYALVGDGSYMMLHSELATSIQEHQKINILLFDNMSFGCINNLQMGSGMPSFITENRFRTSSGLNGKLVEVDFAKNAESYGCRGYTVRNEQELIEALESSTQQRVSTLIDIKVLPKTMTHGYNSFWNTCAIEVSHNQEIASYGKQVKANREASFKY